MNDRDRLRGVKARRRVYETEDRIKDLVQSLMDDTRLKVEDIGIYCDEDRYGRSHAVFVRLRVRY